MRISLLLSLKLAALGIVLCGCAAPSPIGTTRVGPRKSYEQVEANALQTGRPSAGTVSVLHRHALDRLTVLHPDEAVRQLHKKALVSGKRDELFALAELSYGTGEYLRSQIKPTNLPDARDFYLGSALYAYLFLFGDGTEARPNAFDRRFRVACDLYNYGLALGFTDEPGTNAVVRLASGRRRLPVGEIDVQLSQTGAGARLHEAEQLLMTDQFEVRGLAVRNRLPGIGAPLIAVEPLNPATKMRRCSPLTAFLRAPHSLAEVNSGKSTAALEVYYGFGEAKVTIGDVTVPLEVDLSASGAHMLNQPLAWSLGKMQFLKPGAQVQSQLTTLQPYVPGRIPLVLVHGTFASPVTWVDMLNSVIADPELRQRYQVWFFFYSTGNPLPVSASELREALTATVNKLDPEGKDPALHQMVVMGHSQGGLLTKLTATDTGDRVWCVFSPKPLDELAVSDELRAELRRLIFVKPLPFVRRVVFMSTPHRGSYLASNTARKLARWVTALPGKVTSFGQEALRLSKGSEVGTFLHGKMPTSLDSMSPSNPGLLALADIPVAPGITAHSIIPVLGDGDFREGKDGVVAYQSAHVDYVESEYIVRAGHSCQREPATIEEVKRILHEHLKQLPKP